MQGKKHCATAKDKQKKRNEALNLLRTGEIDGKPILNEALRAEYLRLLDHWDDACRANKFNKSHGVIPADEAEAAVSWCIQLAEIIVEEELIHRSHKGGKTQSGLLREMLWKRFENLEAGLSSNGVGRK